VRRRSTSVPIWNLAAVKCGDVPSPVGMGMERGKFWLLGLKFGEF